MPSLSPLAMSWPQRNVSGFAAELALHRAVDALAQRANGTFAAPHLFGLVRGGIAGARGSRRDRGRPTATAVVDRLRRARPAPSPDSISSICFLGEVTLPRSASCGSHVDRVLLACAAASSSGERYSSCVIGVGVRADADAMGIHDRGADAGLARAPPLRPARGSSRRRSDRRTAECFTCLMPAKLSASCSFALCSCLGTPMP